MDRSDVWERRDLLLGGLVGLGGMAGAAGIAPSPAHAATEVPVKPPSSPGGWQQIDDFAGATDGEKLANAMSYAAAQTFIPTLQFPARTFELGTQQYTVYNGMKLAGAGMSTGPKNNEHGDRLVSGKVMTSAGLDAKATFVVTGDVFGVTIAGVVFHGAPGTQLMHTGTTGNLYSAQLDALTVYGFKHVLGSSTQKFLVTQLHITGHWQVLALYGTGFHLGGSDCWLWKAGLLNLGANQSYNGGGAYLMDLDGLSKSFLGGQYITADQNFRALRIRGSGDIDIDGGVYEGFKDTDPTLGTAIRIEGGYTTIRAPRFAYAMRAPLASEHGVIEVTGGRVLIDGAKYEPGATSRTVPFVYVAGGLVMVRSAMGMGGFSPVVRRVGGTVQVDSSVILT